MDSKCQRSATSYLRIITFRAQPLTWMPNDQIRLQLLGLMGQQGQSEASRLHEMQIKALGVAGEKRAEMVEDMCSLLIRFTAHAATLDLPS